jgi:alpha-L-rhamnosidase
VKGYLVRNDYRPRARFRCSNELLDRIHDTVAWTFECLSLGGYTVDCAHRERWGYGGDAHATMETALTHFDLGAFYTKWLADWRDVQGADGDLPYTAPTLEGGGGPAWSGIVIELPWQLYLAYGDERILSVMYPTMERFASFLATKAPGHVLERYGHAEWGFLGDWVPPGRGQSKEERVDERATHLFNNAYYLMSVRRLARIAHVLGKSVDAERFTLEADAIRAAVRARFRDPASGAWVCEDQPYLALILLARLCDEEERPAIVRRLEDAIARKGGHVDSGIHGTYYLLEALHAEGRDDLIFTLATQTSYPGWGDMLARGATTIWEQWDGVHSRMHSSFLSIGAWFLQGLAGIEADPEDPGFAHVEVRPAVVGDLTWVEASFDSPHGRIESRWRRGDDRSLSLHVAVPPNTTASIHLPASEASQVTESARRLEQAGALTLEGIRSGRVVVRVGSGSYDFLIRARP